MKVSVIIPVFNRERYIGSALRSLLRQRDAAGLDIIVIDDGSTDGTAAAVRQIMGEAPPVRYAAQANMGDAGKESEPVFSLAGHLVDGRGSERSLS